MRRRFLVVALMLPAALAVGFSVAFADNGKSGIAKMCQKNGWQGLQTSTGVSFSSQDACVSYGAQGGTLFGPTLVASDDGCVPSFTPPPDFTNEWTIVATGFTPGSVVTINGARFPLFVFDSSGSMTRHVFLPAADAGQMVTLTFVDDSGVHASVTFGPIDDCST